MNKLRATTLQKRLIQLILIASLLSMFSVLVGVVVYESTDFKDRALAQLQVPADILKELLRPALDFNSSEDANRYLKKYSENQQGIQLALVYDGTGEIFASYPPGANLDQAPEVPKSPNHHFSGQDLILWNKIDINNYTLGHIYLHQQLPSLFPRLPQYGLMVGTVLCAILILGITILLGVRRNILAPLRKLTNSIEITNDLKLPLPVDWDNQDELGNLIDGYNKMIGRLKKSNDDRAESERLFRGLFENTEVSVWNEDFSEVNTELNKLRSNGVSDLRQYFKKNEQAVWDMIARVKVVDVNQSTLRLFAATNKHEMLTKINKTFGSNAIEVFIDELCAIWDKQKVFRSEAKFITLDGKPLDLIISFQIPKTTDGFQSIPVNLTDITERKQAEEKIKLAANVFSHAREGIIITDIEGTIIDVNNTFTTTTGYSHEEVVGKNPSFLQSGRQSAKFYADMWQDLLIEGYWSGEIWNRRKNGEVYAEIKTISAVRDENAITTHYVALGNDITQMKEHQNQLEHIAHYDVLTNLPNRVLLADRLSQAMLHCSRQNQSLAVVFLDLDGFKIVNDAYGHDVGDQLLIALSLRMKEALREGDTLARFGGDEFVAVLADLTTVEDCEPILKRFLLAASEPVTVDDVVLKVSASIGVTFYPQDNVDTDQLMRHADQAMYVAKELGKNRYHLFDTDEDNAVKVQRESLEAIRCALDNQEFVLYYQPKVNMKIGTVTGFEALIRWQHPERGLLNPIDFLPVIENHPMSIEMGEWVIVSALSQISQWQTMRQNLPLNISVNIAAVQLQQSNFTQRLTTLLASYPDVDPCYLELEVLETSALEDVLHVSTIMNSCMALGVNFALDDFGTGYSSLTYLRRLPANIIKIDQTFVRDMLHDPDDLAIVEGVIALAQSFKRDVIAEGVETIEHGTALLQLGCELAQGYGIARPMPASDIPAWVSDWKPDASWQI
jgi:diguanylate cyclase (GGDEF)-like protein/PAS domain S-box-containing protein